MNSSQFLKQSSLLMGFKQLWKRKALCEWMSFTLKTEHCTLFGFTLQDILLLFLCFCLNISPPSITSAFFSIFR